MTLADDLRVLRHYQRPDVANLEARVRKSAEERVEGRECVMADAIDAVSVHAPWADLDDVVNGCSYLAGTDLVLEVLDEAVRAGLLVEHMVTGDEGAVRVWQLAPEAEDRIWLTGLRRVVSEVVR